MRLSALRSLAVLATAMVLGHASVAASQDAPFPPGESTQQLEGLKCTVEMPAEFDATKERSLVVILHGLGGSDDGMARSLAHLTQQEFVVVAPKSTGQGWSAKDVEAVRRIVADLRKRLRIGERRLHGCGFSNGGWNLTPVVFDEELRFQSACWVASGYDGGKPPKHAKKEMGVLALAGARDGNRPKAEQTPKMLEGKVRSAEVRIQPELDHAWPDKLVPYYTWWLGVQEGRYVPGACAAFEWKATAKEALDAAVAEKKGAFVYWYSAADEANEKAKAVQNDVLRDAHVQRFGQQLLAAKVSKDEAPEEWAASGLKATPAIVVHDATGKVKSTLQEKIDAKGLAAAFRAVAADKSLPKD